MDIKMGDLWPYKNHHFKPKFPIVLLQERCEIVQFKFGHPVVINSYFIKILYPSIRQINIETQHCFLKSAIVFRKYSCGAKIVTIVSHLL